ncbi:DUF4272 domain-containing protein [Thermodesulfobacteriota bacterium]
MINRLFINPKKIQRENTRALMAMGIPVVDHLPYLDRSKFRKSEEVSKRCLILSAVLQLHFGAPNEFIENWLTSNNLISSLSDNEISLLSTKHEELTEQQQTDLYWSIEAIWAFMWSGGKHPSLTFNTGVEDTLASMLPNIESNESAQIFLSNFKLLPKKDIFTQLDFFYRVHWFARNNYLTGVKSEKADLDIIMERRKALEWICNSSLDWDDIPLDT